MSRPLRRVVLVEDHDLFRAGVRAGLERTVEVVGEAASVAEAVPLIRELDPDVLIIDVELPRRDGIEATREVLRARPRTKVIIFSAHAERWPSLRRQVASN